jgi:FtsZ-binding cell division protein ZapB
LVLDIRFESAPKLQFHIIIFPKDGKNLTGGAAYAKGDSTKSTPNVFHIYPAKEHDEAGETIMLDQKSDDGFDYSCLYYGTENDEVIGALMDRSKKDFDVVSWTNYISLVAKVAGLENEATKSKEENEGLKKRNEVLSKGNEDLKNGNEDLRKGNEDLRKGNEDLRKGSEDLRKGSEDLRKGSEDLRKGSEELRKRNEDLKKEKDGLQAKDDRLQAAVKATAKVIVDAIEDLKNDDKNKTSNTGS